MSATLEVVVARLDALKESCEKSFKEITDRQDIANGRMNGFDKFKYMMLGVGIVLGSSGFIAAVLFVANTIAKAAQ